MRLAIGSDRIGSDLLSFDQIGWELGFGIWSGEDRNRDIETGDALSAAHNHIGFAHGTGATRRVIEERTPAEVRERRAAGRRSPTGQSRNACGNLRDGPRRVVSYAGVESSRSRDACVARLQVIGPRRRALFVSAHLQFSETLSRSLARDRIG